MRDSSYCWTHDPSFEEERLRAARRGGRTGGRGRPSEIAQIKDKLRTLADDLLKPEVGLERGDAAVVAQIYNTILAAIRTELKQREQEDLVSKMEEIEDELARQRGRGF